MALRCRAGSPAAAAVRAVPVRRSAARSSLRRSAAVAAASPPASAGSGAPSGASGRSRRRQLPVDGPTPATHPRRGDAGHVRLAVGADRPRLVERPRAVRAALLELAQAARAAHEVPLDAVVAVRALPAVDLRQPRLGGLHLQLPLAHVLEVLRRAQDQVDDRTEEGEAGDDGREPTITGSAIRRRASW